MDMQSPLLATLPNAILDLTTNLAPLFFGLIGVLYYCAVVVATWVHDT